MSLRRATLAGGGLIATCVAAALLSGRSDSTRTQNPVVSAVTGSHVEHATVDPARVAAPSLERRYDLKLESTVTARGETILSYQLTADWLVAGIEASGAELFVRSQLERPTLQSSTALAEDASKLRAFEQTLSLPHFFTMDAEGAVSETRMHRKMPTFVQSTIRWVVAATQFVTAKLDAPSWEKEESDASGRYRARYEVVSPGRYRKQKLEYLTPPAGGAASPFQPEQTTQVLESQSTFSLGQNCEITSLDVVERTRVPGSGPLPEMTSTTKLTLRLKNTVNADPRIAAKNSELEQTVASKLNDPPTRSARRADVDQSKIAGRSLSQMLSGHRAASGDDRDAVTQRAREYVGVAALLRQDDKARADAVARIERGDADAPLLIDALGDAGDPASQKALIGLLDKARLDDKEERGALIALSLVDEPTDTAISALRKRLDDPDLGTQASYGLGAYAHELDRSDPARAREVLDVLVNRLKASKDKGEITRYLEAIGNAGHPGALPTIDAYLADTDGTIRAAALRALRRIPGSGVDQRLASAMTRDAVSGVRNVAVDLVSQRSPSPPLVEAVAASSRFEPVLNVRLDVVRILTRWMSQNAELARIGQWLLGNDPDETIRATVRRALEARNG